MTKVLDLTSYIPQPARVRIGDREYEVRPFTVEQMLVLLEGEVTEEDLSRAAAGQLSPKNIEVILKMLRAAIADIDDATLRSLPIPALMELVRFVAEYQEEARQEKGQTPLPQDESTSKTST